MRHQDDNIKRMLAGRASQDTELIPIYVSGLDYISVMTEEDTKRRMLHAPLAAAYIGIPLGDLYDLVNKGRFSPRQHKDNASLYFLIEELDSYIKGDSDEMV